MEKSLKLYKKSLNVHSEDELEFLLEMVRKLLFLKSFFSEAF